MAVTIYIFILLVNFLMVDRLLLLKKILLYIQKNYKQLKKSFRFESNVYTV